MIFAAFAISIVTFAYGQSKSAIAESSPCSGFSICKIDTISTLKDKLASIEPTIKQPSWVLSIKKFTYSTETRGNITADLTEFNFQVNETLNDNRSWEGLGIWFEQVKSGGDFVIVLSEASKVTAFSTSCDNFYSCRVGKYVILNQDRWLGATDTWNKTGGNLRDYRNMLVNHEIGHWLGHEHENCSAPGQLAPVMRQQSVDLQGCKFNPWPLPSEMWTNRL